MNLKGISVLTEVGSGNFIVTPLIAAMAGAEKVFAVTRDSKYGKAKDLIKELDRWSIQLGLDNSIIGSAQPPKDFAAESNIVTNLGFVRPIGRDLISGLPTESCIPLMWEPWEYRVGDIDLESCRQLNVPVVGTNEEHPRLKIFEYVGMLVVKLLLEREIEIFRSKILVLGSNPFGQVSVDALRGLGSDVCGMDCTQLRETSREELEDILLPLDAIVLVENRCSDVLISEGSGIPIAVLESLQIPIVHVCGNLDYSLLQTYEVDKYPETKTGFGTMTQTTAYVGPKPCIDLHAAGLKVGEVVVRALKRGESVEQAIDSAVASGWGLRL